MICSEEEKERFRQVRDAVVQERGSGGIGTLSEKTLHAVLKAYYEPCEASREVRLGRYIADIVGENGIIEIQTGQFNKLREKLVAFLPCAPVTVVYPIAAVKWLSWVDMQTGELRPKRKSPKKGTAFQAVRELYKIKPLLKTPGLTIELVFVDMMEYRYLNGWSTDGKKGSTRMDRYPLELVGRTRLAAAADYASLLPAGLPEPFTTRDLQKAARIPLSQAQTALNLCTFMDAVERVGKRGNSILYRLRLG